MVFKCKTNSENTIVFLKFKVLSSQPAELIHLADIDIWFTEMKKEKSMAQ